MQIKQSGGKKEELERAVSSILGTEAEVSCLKQHQIVECNDIDLVSPQRRTQVMHLSINTERQSLT